MALTPLEQLPFYVGGGGPVTPETLLEKARFDVEQTRLAIAFSQASAGYAEPYQLEIERQQVAELARLVDAQQQGRLAEAVFGAQQPQQFRAFGPGPVVEVTQMSFIGDLIGGIGEVAKQIGGGLAGAAGAVVGALPTIAQGAASAAAAINAIQNSLSGNPTLPINPTTGSPMPMASMAMNPLSQYSAALAAECGAMPTPQCGANFDARLQAFTAALGGGQMTMPINPMTGTPNVVGAGVATDVFALARQALMNPGVAAALRAVGLGGLIGAGEAGVSALVAGLSGGGAVGAVGVRGPLLMQWPAGTPYPRGIVLRAPDKPEKGYRSKGSALLLSGDVAAVRRVQKAATRARRGRRSTRSSARTVYALPAPGAHHVCGSCLSSPCGCGGK